MGIGRVFSRKSVPSRDLQKAPYNGLVIASAVLLFAELLIIRWTGAELWSLAFFKNLVLIAAFLGSGLGIAIGSRKPGLVWLAPSLLVVEAFGVAWLSKSGILENLQFGGEGDFFWQVKSAATVFQSVTFLLFFVGIFLIGFLHFVAFGIIVGRELEGKAALPAYGWNLVGSLIGVVGFAAVSIGETGPGTWLLILAVPLGLVVTQGPLRVFAVALTAVAALIVVLSSEPATWSPYSRITVDRSEVEGSDGGEDYSLNVNRAYHMTMVDLSQAASLDGWYGRATLHYDLPYDFVTPEKVLVLGAGGGNDVAAALRNGARQVDAVEIDPVIVRFGRKLHPEQPYGDPRVKVHVDDARSFLQRDNTRYDLVTLGLLDSHTLLAGLPGVRLDNFVYTVEALRAARDRLSPTGVLSLSFAAIGDRPWLGRKLYRLMEEAFGEAPLVYPIGYDFSITYIAGPGLKTEQAKSAALQLEWRSADMQSWDPAEVSVPTDDWPQLYLRVRGIPGPQLLLVGLLVLLSLGLTRVMAPFTGRPDVHFALLGAGFLLVETKGIADLGLLFGGTWWTVTSVIAAVLLMALLSVLYVAKVSPKTVMPYYAFLFAALALTWAVRPGDLLSLPLLAAQCSGALLVAVPVFFSGIIFTISLARARNVPRALGSNLLGAVLGGFLEYASMIWGMRSLSLLAIGLYLLSALALGRSRRE
ncbi:MAG: hypothetical protein K8R59_08025 [Thermoanaerobaculales bacterium]|nr:hypothetical protein [Thermoanaerobaculales bacterium]